MHDCSEQINFQSSFLEKGDFIYLCPDIIPDVAAAVAARERVRGETLNLELAACRWCMYVCVYPVSFIFQ